MGKVTEVEDCSVLLGPSKLDSVQKGFVDGLLQAEQGGVFSAIVANQDQQAVAWPRGTRVVLFLLSGFVSFAVLPMVWCRLRPALLSWQLHQTNAVMLDEVLMGTDGSGEIATNGTSSEQAFASPSSDPTRHAPSELDFALAFHSKPQVKDTAWTASVSTSDAPSEPASISKVKDAVQTASVSTGSTSSKPALVRDAVQTASVSTGSTSSKPALVKDAVQNGRVPTSSTSSKPAVATRKKPSDWPALFCFALMMPHGPELALMKSHFTRGVGVFACNDQAVFCSGGRIALGGTGNSMFHTLPVPNIKMSKGNVAIPGQTTNSWLNTKLFTKVFEAMLHDGRFWAYDWVIKVDPDAVFFPNRLRQHVAPLTGNTGPDAVYIRNCGKNPYIHLMGAIEVFSKKAMQTYFDKKWKCERDLKWQGWGEDYYMEHCLNHLGVRYVDDYKLLGQSSCEFAPCQNGWFAAFHPFKDVNSWWQCWNSSSTGKF